MHTFVGSKNFGTGFGLHWLGVNVIAVVVVGNEELVVASAGGNDETTGLISEDLTRGGHAAHETHVGAGTVGRTGREGVLGFMDVRCRAGLCGTLVLADVVKVALDHWA